VIMAETSLRGLHTHAIVKRFGHGRYQHAAVRNVTFSLLPGARVGIVGESGSGKSTLGRLLVGLDTVSEGSITFDGQDLNDILRSPARRLEFRRAVQLVAQDTSSSFDPLRRLRHAMRVPAQQLAGLDHAAADARVEEVLAALGVPAHLADRYPYEVSGGQRQRFALARALVVRPRFFVCDEVVSALDVSVQGQVLNLLKRSCIDSGAALAFISHGLPATAFVATELAVMVRGEIIERGATADILARSTQAYTKHLLEAHRVSRHGRRDAIQRPVAPARPSAPGLMARAADMLLHQRWWLARVAALPGQLLVFALLAFVLVRMIPGDPVRTITGGQATPATYAAVQHRIGLDGSFLQQLVRYLGQLLHLDLGISLLTGRTLASEFAQRLPATLELAAMGLGASLLVTLIASAIAVMRPGGLSAWVIRSYAKAAGAIPDFAIGVLGIFLFYATLHWVPAPLGRLDLSIQAPPRTTGLPFVDAVLSGNGPAIISMAQHLVLPVLVMVSSYSAVLLKQLIAGLDEELDRPATLFRISTGAPMWMVLLSVYRRALPATVTMAGTVFGYLIGGAIIIESLFGFDGMGQYLMDAVAGADLTAMQGFLVTIAAVSLVVFLLVDVINMVIDPRRRPGVQGKDDG